MANKVTMQMIEADYNKYKETVQIEFEDTDPKTNEIKTYTINLFPYFEPQRIDKAIMSLQKDLIELNQREDIKFNDELIPLFVIYHTILEFTDLPKPRSKSIQRRFSYFTSFVNSKYFKLVEEHLIESEVYKVWDKVMRVVLESERLERMANKFKNELLNYDFKTPEIRDAVLNSLDKNKE